MGLPTLPAEFQIFQIASCEDFLYIYVTQHKIPFSHKFSISFQDWVRELKYLEYFLQIKVQNFIPIVVQGA